MKVFIWNDPYDVSWGASILIVCANTEAEARDKAKSARRVQFSVHDNDKEVSIDGLGAPDAVLDAPAAICYEWSE
jgi:alkanesulfonate monooxygenase SsuD/methylene tetrahydromethanopterin reductase-like flavin-dependent oxidoreductase (luciferase family)